MIKILHVITGMGSGGAESMIMNWYRNIDRTKVQFDFLLRSQENIYEQEIEQLGGKVYYMPEFPKKYFSNYVRTNIFFKEHASEYLAIHVHGNALIYTNVFNIAKRYGIQNRIMHSHNTSTKSKFFLPLHQLNKCRIKRLANYYFACSEEAGIWCFNKGYTVINNGIDVEKFRYNEEKRAAFRQTLNIESDTFVICHIGRFLESKNHEFIIKVFYDYQKRNENSKLLLVGIGPLMEKYKKTVCELGIKDKVEFLGVRTDIPDVLSASDLFLFPSLFEGLPVSLIEAQANGIFCLASITISKESKVSEAIKYLPIDVSPEFWCEKIEINDIEKRKKAYEYVGDCNYNIKNVAQNVQNVYLSMIG